jgi:hypothetical protein
VDEKIATLTMLTPLMLSHSGLDDCERPDRWRKPGSD